MIVVSAAIQGGVSGSGGVCCECEISTNQADHVSLIAGLLTAGSLACDVLVLGTLLVRRCGIELLFRRAIIKILRSFSVD